MKTEHGEKEGETCSPLPDDVIKTLRHCRLFIGERRGYRNNEEMERDDICKRIDAILSATSQSTPPPFRANLERDKNHQPPIPIMKKSTLAMDADSIAKRAQARQRRKARAIEEGRHSRTNRQERAKQREAAKNQHSSNPRDGQAS